MPQAAVHIAQSLQRALDALIGFIPNLLGFLVILLIGYIVARLIKVVVTKLLEKVGLDRALSGSPGRGVRRARKSGSQSITARGCGRVLVHLHLRDRGGRRRAGRSRP